MMFLYTNFRFSFSNFKKKKKSLFIIFTLKYNKRTLRYDQFDRLLNVPSFVFYCVFLIKLYLLRKRKN